MQKVVYVLLQQHAERYWQADHDDESDIDIEESYSGKLITLSLFFQSVLTNTTIIDAPRRRYHTIGRRTERDRRCLSMVDNNSNISTVSAPAFSTVRRGSQAVAPWMPPSDSPTPNKDVLRRYSAATIRSVPTNRTPPAFFDELPASPQLPFNPNEEQQKSSAKMKKSETFYARFVKNVLSSGRRGSKDTRCVENHFFYLAFFFINHNSFFSCRNNSISHTSEQHSPASNTTATTVPSTPQPSSSSSNNTTKQPITATLVGTLRRKNPFHRAPINTTDFVISPTSMEQQSQQNDILPPTSPIVPPKSTLRPTSHILQRNKIDPTTEDDDNTAAATEIEVVESPRKSNKSATLRMSLRLPIAFTRNSNKDSSATDGAKTTTGGASNEAGGGTKKFGFTLGSNARKQRKQLDLSLFSTEQQEQPTSKSAIILSNNESDIKSTNAAGGLLPPGPIISDGSTLSSSSSSTCSSTHSSSYSNIVTTSSSKNLKNNVTNTKQTPRRSSQASFKSMDRRASNTTINQQHRPTTPSLLSNSSAIQSPTTASMPPIPSPNSIPSQPAKASWLNNLFFFKQPKVCSLVVYSTHTAGILRSLHRLMNKVKKEKSVVFLNLWSFLFAKNFHLCYLDNGSTIL